MQKENNFIYKDLVKKIIKKENPPLVAILILAFFLRIYKLSDTMHFISDQGLFYLPALDMVLNGKIPLVGPESSHPWIHHGPIFIYLLAIILPIFNFNPIAPAYFLAVIDVATVLILYLILKSMFNKQTAFLATLLYASSPYIIINARFPYHTTLLPFFAILLFFLTYKWIKGSVWVFPAITFLLGLLYNHELTTFVYFITIGLILAYGFIKKESWFKELFNKKIFFASIISFLIPMTPFILYDVSHGYRQTLGFLAWVGYRIVKFPFSLIDPSFVSSTSGPSTLPLFFSYYQNLVFAHNTIIALLILFITIIFSVVYIRNTLTLKGKALHLKKNIPLSYILLFLFLTVSFMGLFIHRIPTGADTLIIFPFIIILTSLAIVWLFRNRFIIAIICAMVISFFNIIFLFSTQLITDPPSRKPALIKKKLEAVDKVISISSDKPYNIIGKGELSNYPSFVMPYVYLLRWKKHAPEAREVPLKIVVWEKGDEIIVYQEND